MSINQSDWNGKNVNDQIELEKKMSVYNEIEMRFAKLRWRMDWPVDLYNVSSRSSIVRCKINSYFYLSRIVWNGNYFDRKIKNVELLTSYDDWTVVDCYRRSCCIMDSSQILPNTDCFKHKNKITSDKHWHCSMICLLTTTTKKWICSKKNAPVWCVLTGLKTCYWI